MASTTIADRGSAVRLRSFTPSTSNSKEPESSTAYITGTTCDHPVGPTVAKRPIRCERRNSSSASLNNAIRKHILDSRTFMAKTADLATETIGGYTIRRRQPLDRLDGAYIELEHDRTGARPIHIESSHDNNPFAPFFPTVPNDATPAPHNLPPPLPPA